MFKENDVVLWHGFKNPETVERVSGDMIKTRFICNGKSGGVYPANDYRYATPDDMRRAGFEEQDFEKLFTVAHSHKMNTGGLYRLNDGTYWRLKEEKKQEEKDMEDECLTPVEIFEAWLRNRDQIFASGGRKFQILKIVNNPNRTKRALCIVTDGCHFNRYDKGNSYFTTHSETGKHIKLCAEPLDPRAATITKAAALRECGRCWAEHIEDCFGDRKEITVREAMGYVFGLPVHVFDRVDVFTKMQDLGLIDKNRAATGKSLK